MSVANVRTVTPLDVTVRTDTVWCRSGEFEGVCQSPQLLLSGHLEACMCCHGCIQVVSSANRQRRRYWFYKRKGGSHV